MENAAETIKGLERKFWQSLVNHEIDTALGLLCEPAVLVNAQGARRVDHDTYRRMAESGRETIASFELGDMDVLMPSGTLAIVTYEARQVVTEPGGHEGVQRVRDTSTWIRTGGGWKCAAHTETPVDGAANGGT